MHHEIERHLPFMKNQKVIRCVCGKEILLIPDVKEMDRALALHAESHARKEEISQKAEAVFEQIQEYLVEQTLAAASEEETKKENESSDS